jgi:hypothetical protein
MGQLRAAESARICGAPMTRYRRQFIEPESYIAKIAEETKHLREELQEMVQQRRRSDFMASAGDRPRKKRKRPTHSTEPSR